MEILPPQIARAVRQKEPVLWLNDLWRPQAEALSARRLSTKDLHAAARRLDQCAGLLMKLFPELAPSAGIIESPLYPANALKQALVGNGPGTGRWFIKADHALPVAGSIKARGGIYEVLVYAEKLALAEHVMKPDDDRIVLASPQARELFANHQIAVGSTGNLGLGIGTIAAALGFRATVHMSHDAKEWKKARLRARYVEVIEHRGDFGAAVAAGRESVRDNPQAYFVDDENSEHLFLGYSVAALRLREQLRTRGVQVDSAHPLFVYLPCGVGGAPGGITFGLRELFGDNVHCFFAEPVAAPCMLLRLASNADAPISVREVGLDNCTEADGLAVAQASEFAARMVRSLVSGVFTVPDEVLFEDLYVLERTEGLRIEPSAAGGFGGPSRILQSRVGEQYLDERDIRDRMNSATHILWTTGGAFVPEEEYRAFHERGRSRRDARAHT